MNAPSARTNAPGAGAQTKGHEVRFMVFDVESVGLHGEGFAVGYVVVDTNSNKPSQFIGERLLVCPPTYATGNDGGRKWIAGNVPDMPLNCSTPRDVRTQFWAHWELWREQGARLLADCAWPVEARFLAQCVDDDSARTLGGPYPLLDLSSILLAYGMDPTTVFYREPDELPPHNPLNDARQSARLLLEHIRL